ncbi:MAG: hypothetical protein HYS25_14430 [Ignavibacteriales bacterium]|nr:hypothetical protein [Ignavibacteriales bacterium]
MINDKMCIGVDKDDIMLRCEPEGTDELPTKKGVRLFDLTGKPMKCWLLVHAVGTSSKKDFGFWVKTAIEQIKKQQHLQRKKSSNQRYIFSR